MDTTVRDMSAAAGAPVIAAALFEGRLSVWDTNREDLICSFESIFDFGGRRLTVDRSGIRLFAGSYRKRRLCCYDIPGAHLIWEQRALGAIQHINADAVPGTVICGVDGPTTFLLDGRDGKIMERIPGVHWLAGDRDLTNRLLIRNPIRLVKHDLSVVDIPSERFAVLDADVGPDCVAFSEATGDVRCIATAEGRLRWRYVPPDGHHVLRLKCFPGQGKFYAIERQYLGGKADYSLLKIDADSGYHEVIQYFKHIPASAFSRHDELLYCYDGSAVDVRTGEIVKRLPLRS